MYDPYTTGSHQRDQEKLIKEYIKALKKVYGGVGVNSTTTDSIVEEQDRE